MHPNALLVPADPAALTSSPSDMELAQLHANAENALALALWHLRQPVANVPGAARKTVQALKALHALRAVPLAPTSKAGRA